MSASASPIPYTGSKSCIVDTILDVMPPHTVYIEPCMGSAEVFFRKQPAEREIINDFNGDLVNLFRVLQNNQNLATLLGRIYLSVNAELLFQRNKELLKRTPNLLDDLAETEKIMREASWDELQHAVAFFENQVYSFSSTGQCFGIMKRDITQRLSRLIAACCRLRDASILHRDYKDAISYGACENCFILLDPPYKGTEGYYPKADFDSSQHAVLFDFMSEIDRQFAGECKFLITYNNDPVIRSLAESKGFDTFVQSRLHNMRQASEAGALFEELLIANYDLVAQAEENKSTLFTGTEQLSLFDHFNYDYLEENKNEF
ncbi:MAG: DNA adenine methylase [Lachnospiraceae bacterium]|nr:DNA adenine methylase [Lachnospiraceae bacterium]